MLESFIIHRPETAFMVHSLLENLALSAGALYYHQIKKKSTNTSVLHHKQWLGLLVGCLLGAGIGNKVVSILEFPEICAWLLDGRFKDFFLVLISGQSIVGGLLGGWLGVEISKKIMGIHSRTGDDFVRPILLGLLIGRVGCFLAGLYDGTYGIHTNVPWAVDFGDGPRHPTQLYEWLFVLITLVTLPHWQKYFIRHAGLTFRVWMACYLIWRLLIDSLKPIPFGWPLGLSGIQWVCIITLIFMGLTYLKTSFYAQRIKQHG